MSKTNVTDEELIFEFEMALGQRLADAERLLRWFVQLHASALVELDVGYEGPRRVLMVFTRFAAGRIGPRDEQRLRFWVARCAGRVRRGSGLPPAEREALRRALSRCDARAIAVAPSGAAKAVTTIATVAGLDTSERSYAEDRPTLAIEIGGPGWEGVRWSQVKETLFIPTPNAPPLGDPIPVVFRFRSLSGVAIDWARVVEVRSEADATPDRPAGFALAFDPSQRALRRQLAHSAPAASPERGAAPHFERTRPIAV